jgi:hypothetical protein
MACNCGKRRVYEHVAPDGARTEVKSQSEAIRLVREHGGTWKLKS